MTQFKRLVVLVFLGCGFSVSAQITEGWKVVEANNAGKAGQPLPGVTIQYGCDSRGVETQGLMASDMNGYFDNLLALTECPSTCWASFSFVGYEPRQLSCTDIERKGGVVVLTSQTEALDAVVVTASISGSTVEEETVPVTVLKPYLAESANALDLKGLVSKTPGVSILDGQVSIRGGSGYSYGVGSRVQMLLDGMPLLSGDLGRFGGRTSPWST